MTDDPSTKSEKDRESFAISTWLLSRLLGLVHLAAFWSYGAQMLMLNGSSGVCPTRQLLERVHQYLGAEAFLALPALTWLNASDTMLVSICVAGVVLSLMVIAGVLTGPCLTLLAILYLSIVNGGGVFTGFQSDGLLVEATVIALFLVSWRPLERPWKGAPPLSSPPAFSLWLMRFLLFRLMFAAGLVKIMSGDPSWQDLTAMAYHYETQPIPSPAAWFFYHLPLPVHKLESAATFVVELLAPPLMFFGRRCRLVAGISFMLLHAMIIVTGNYSFLNYLTAFLSLCLIEDRYLRKILPGRFVSSLIPEESSPEEKKREPFRLAVSALAGLLFLAGASRFLAGLGVYLPVSIMTGLRAIAPFHIANSYGMFAVMTTQRPEIVFEGSDDLVHWQEYSFRFKVDALDKAPPVMAPHMPRLEWRLWFEAMDVGRTEPWVLNLCRLMLRGDQEVMRMFVPCPYVNGKPPRYLRAFVYNYHFTDFDKLEKGQWWWRDDKRLFIPPVELDGDFIKPVSTD
ncbi:MAG: lipase maturation factor family protein [Candidatus Obscuribacterales bacterium]